MRIALILGRERHCIPILKRPIIILALSWISVYNMDSTIKVVNVAGKV